MILHTDDIPVPDTPDTCQCADPALVSECCGALLVGLRCAECHDNAVAECSACERAMAQGVGSECASCERAMDDEQPEQGYGDLPLCGCGELTCRGGCTESQP